MKVQAVGLFWFRDAIQYHELKNIFTDADVLSDSYTSGNTTLKNWLSVSKEAGNELLKLKRIQPSSSLGVQAKALESMPKVECSSHPLRLTNNFSANANVIGAIEMVVPSYLIVIFRSYHHHHFPSSVCARLGCVYGMLGSKWQRMATSSGTPRVFHFPTPWLPRGLPFFGNLRPIAALVLNWIFNIS